VASTTRPANAGFAGDAFVDGTERLLQVPVQEITKTVTSNEPCLELRDPTWAVTECDQLKTAIGDAIWLLDHPDRAVDNERVRLYVKRDDSRWDLALEASDSDGQQFEAEVATSDLAGDRNPKVVFVLREVDKDPTDGASSPLFVDVVEPSGAIVVHVVARAGRSGKPEARAVPGRGIEVWDCPVDCVPTAPLRYRRIAYQEGRWQVVEQGSGQPPT
jgi:hypothetical protein